MIKVYIKLLEFSHIPILYPNLGFLDKNKSLFINEAFRYFKDPIFEIVEDPSKADYFLIPHEYFFVEKDKPYIQEYLDLSEKYNKKILVFTHTDIEEEVKLKNVIVFRISQYRYQKKSNEVMMPPYAEDLLYNRELQFRNKTSKKPIIGFCGWANFESLRQIIAYHIKNIILSLKILLTGNKKANVHKRGIWFRKKTLNILQKSNLVTANFLIRDSFSGHKSTMKLDPNKARKDYIENMVNSDFALAVKGGGNNSLRFYEALSLGRIPVLLNTDCILPLEDIIDYKEFVLFVDYKDMKKMDVLINEFYNKLSDEDFVNMQKKGRQAFEKYLRIDSFFKQIPEILQRRR